MDEEGVPSTTLREISLLKMLSESNHIVKCVPAVRRSEPATKGGATPCGGGAPGISQLVVIAAAIPHGN
jgi:hypothetical protein